MSDHGEAWRKKKRRGWVQQRGGGSAFICKAFELGFGSLAKEEKVEDVIK